MERSNFLRMKYYRLQGHRVRLISLHPIGAGAPLYEEAHMPVMGCDYQGKFGLISHHKLRKLVKSYPADVIFVTGPSISSCLAASAQRVPRILCVHYHHGFTLAQRLKWKAFYAYFSKTFVKITFCSDFIRSEAESIYPPLEQKSVTLKNIFEIPPESEIKKKSEARGKLGLPLKVPIIGNAGWFINRKRFDLLLIIASFMIKEIPDLHVAIAGGGECESMLKQLAQDLGLKDRVHWLGWLMDLSDFYKSIDVLVFNSDFEALGRTPVEAMAYGVPVVASVSYGGIKEALRNNESGFLIEEHDVMQLVGYTSTLLHDDNLRREMGNSGRKWVEKNLSSEIIGEQLDRLLQNCFE